MTDKQVYWKIHSTPEGWLRIKISQPIKDRWTLPPNCSIGQQMEITLRMGAVQTRHFQVMLEILYQAGEDYDER
jgi:hypothetical protein